MLNRYKLLTVTHKTIPLDHIRYFVLEGQKERDLRGRLAAIKEEFRLGELFYMPTCNRVMYLFTSEKPLTTEFIRDFFAFSCPQLPVEITENLDDSVLRLEGLAALNHLLEVAGSVDSMVIGERQILRQLREAYERCRQWQITGDDIRMAIDRAIVSAKTVYSKTRIGEKPISIVSLAIQKLLDTQLPKTARLLVIGAGQTNALVAKFLAKHGFSHVKVFNRTLEKAERLAEVTNGTAHPFEELKTYEQGFDCLIICTGSAEPIIKPALYRQLLGGESDEKVIIDLAIPHNVSKDVTKSFAINYIEIDGLKSLAQENLSFREQEVIKVRQFLKADLYEFPNFYRQRQLELAMQRIPTEIKAVKEKAINEVFRKEVATLDEDSRKLLERMMNYMEKKCIGIPMKAAREAIIA